ncbi:glycosyltransferase family 4 protein [Lihuaxuella thermophila]|uniref:Glycosyltransferase involved in cell wall bisynthesis n=1 Tax=Lihuaxuella thermophila TaxID=1173111 RepID=A0A1H8CEJ9_9BACL|nr:glycosyltransferase family 4 protein [Lihuaxuella thermophila]SEM93503.1 Glycosyltransferase involved in cell wall bisynthesis [Lihuaxuella thermophila]
MPKADLAAYTLSYKKGESMKVVQVVTQMEGGGAQRVAVLLAEQLMKRGHETEVWFLYQKRDTYASLPWAKVFLSHPPGNLFDVCKILFTLAVMIIKTKPQVLISHTHYSNVIVQSLALLLGVKRRIAVQHSPVESYPKLALLLDRIIGSMGVYTRNIVVSGAVYESLKRYPKSYIRKVMQIDNGIPFSQPTMDREELRERFSIPGNAPLLVNVGRLSKPKNQRVLIEMMPFLPGFHLVIAGDGELRDDLKKFSVELGCEDRVHLIGEVAPEDVVNILHMADIFIFPSLYEAMGIALIEAMNQGLPIIASDIPATREVTGAEEGVHAAILVSPEDTVGFIEAVNRVLADQVLAERLGKKAKERAKRYRVEDMADKYIDCSL